MQWRICRVLRLSERLLDTVNHEACTVIDHNSEFAVGQILPEPGTWAALLGGIGALGLCRRRRAV